MGSAHMLQQCVGMMAGPTDEHRFVALLVLPRLLGELGQQPEDGAAAAAGGDDDGRVEALSVVQAKILEALDWPFFRRLLAPFSSTVDGVELEVANAKAAQMQAVAVAVLSSLCEQDGLSAHPRLADVAMLLPLLAAAFHPAATAAASHPLGDSVDADWPVLRDLAVLVSTVADAAGRGGAALVAVTGEAVVELLLALLRAGHARIVVAAPPAAVLVTAEETCSAAAIGLHAILAAGAAKPGTLPAAALYAAAAGAATMFDAQDGRTAQKEHTPSALELVGLGLLGAVTEALPAEPPPVEAAAHTLPRGWPAAARRGLAPLLASRAGVTPRGQAFELLAGISDWLGRAAPSTPDPEAEDGEPLPCGLAWLLWPAAAAAAVEPAVAVVETKAAVEAATTAAGAGEEGTFGLAGRCQLLRVVGRLVLVELQMILEEDGGADGAAAEEVDARQLLPLCLRLVDHFVSAALLPDAAALGLAAATGDAERRLVADCLADCRRVALDLRPLLELADAA
jgi:hypothetical protein